MFSTSAEQDTTISHKQPTGNKQMLQKHTAALQSTANTTELCHAKYCLATCPAITSFGDAPNIQCTDRQQTVATGRKSGSLPTGCHY